MNLAAFFKSLLLSVSPLKMTNQSGHIIPGDVPAKSVFLRTIECRQEPPALLWWKS